MWQKQSAFYSGQTTNDVFLQYERDHPYQGLEPGWIKKWDKNRYAVQQQSQQGGNVVSPASHKRSGGAVASTAESAAELWVAGHYTHTDVHDNRLMDEVVRQPQSVVDTSPL